MMLTAALMVAAGFVAVRAPAHAAVDPSAVTWVPGEVSWAVHADGRCVTSQGAEVSAQSSEDAVILARALRNLPRKTDFPADTGIEDIHANASDPQLNDSSFIVNLHAYLPGEECQAATAAQELTGSDGGARLDSVQLAAMSTWKKIAITGLVAAALYAAVSMFGMATMAALGVDVVGSTAAQILTGCLGGTMSAIAAGRLISDTKPDWKESLTTAISGCVTGGASGVLQPTARLASAIGNVIGARLSAAAASAAAAVTAIGEAAVRAAVQAGIDVGIASEVLDATWMAHQSHRVRDRVRASPCLTSVT